jgi:hypothetical protein
MPNDAKVWELAPYRDGSGQIALCEEYRTDGEAMLIRASFVVGIDYQVGQDHLHGLWYAGLILASGERVRIKLHDDPQTLANQLFGN